MSWTRRAHKTLNGSSPSSEAPCSPAASFCAGARQRQGGLAANAAKLRVGRRCQGWVSWGGVEPVGAEAGAGEEPEPAPFAELGEHVAGLDAEQDGQVVAAPVAGRLAGDDGGGLVAAGGPVRAQEGRYPAAVGPALAGASSVQRRGADGDVDRGDGGREGGAAVVAGVVAGGGALDVAGAVAGPPGGQQGVQD